VTSSAAAHRIPDGLLDLYVVHWPRRSFAKVGITKNQRWRLFANHGGRAVSVWRLPAEVARQVEQTAHADLRRLFAQAFGTRDEADPYIRCAGGGYLECYTDDTGTAVQSFVSTVVAAVAPDAEAVNVP